MGELSSKVGERLTCIVVDDHDELLSSTAKLLEDTGYDVVGEAGSGQDAIGLLAEYNPDIVVLDTRLPDMSAIEVATAVTRLGLKTATVIHTSQASQTFIQEALNAGVRGIAHKSVPPRSLLDTVASVVRESDPYIDPIFLS